MAQKLFVGGLPFSTSNDQLRDLFAEVGEVASATVVTDRDTGRSRWPARRSVTGRRC